MTGQKEGNNGSYNYTPPPHTQNIQACCCPVVFQAFWNETGKQENLRLIKKEVTFEKTQKYITLTQDNHIYLLLTVTVNIPQWKNIIISIVNFTINHHYLVPLWLFGVPWHPTIYAFQTKYEIRLTCFYKYWQYLKILRKICVTQKPV